MSPSPEIEEWKRLGFWFEYGEGIWHFRGTRRGLEKFAALLREYAEEPLHAGLSEHEHYGPYGDLKVITWSTSLISGEGIWGLPADISRFGDMVRDIARAQPIGKAVRVSDAYGKNNSAEFEITVVTEDEVTLGS